MTARQTPELPTDAALVAAYRNGDQRAATELVGRHAGPVGRFLYASGASSSDVDDLVQDTFFRAFRGLDGWRGEASFRSWLFTIGGNLLRDEFRKRKGRQMLSLDDRDLPDSADPHASSPRPKPSGGCGTEWRRFRGCSVRCFSAGRSRGATTRRSRRRSAPPPAPPGCITITP